MSRSTVKTALKMTATFHLKGLEEATGPGTYGGPLLRQQ